MEIPKTITKNGRKYRFIKQCNDNLFLYQDVLYGHKECFCKYDLGLVQKQPAMSYGQLKFIS